MSERKRTTADEEAAARSTDRPPSPEAEIQADIAAAIKASKTSSPGRYGPPAATAKIRPFELAQALALSSGDVEAHHHDEDKPLREDDAPFVAPDVEVVGEEEITSGIPSGETSPHAPAADPASKSPRAAPAVAQVPSAKKAAVAGLTSTLASEDRDAKTARAPQRSYMGLAVFALLLGAAVCAYVCVYANR